MDRDVIRADEKSLLKVGLNIKADGEQPKGRPKQRWCDTLDGELCVIFHPDRVFDRTK